MTRTTLLSHATAVALGVAITLASGGVEYANAIDYTLSKNVEMELPPGAADTFEGFITTQFCPKVEEAFALEEGVCNLDMIQNQTNGLCEFWRDTDGDGVGDTWVLAAHTRNVPGSWTPQVPQ